MVKKTRQSKECVGCSDTFITYHNYDYCSNCTLNNSRYVQNHCPECGDGSGWVKFPQQKPRPCKLCHLTKKNMNENNETQFWNEVETKSKNIIANLIEKNLPISATPQVFDLEKDVDYRVLLRDDLPGYYADSEEYQTKITQPSWSEADVEYVAQHLAVEYWRLVLKRVISDLAQFSAYDPSYFTNLTD